MKTAEFHPLLRSLQGGDRRSIGEARRALAAVEREPALIDVLFEGMKGDDALVRMRCADAAEKATRAHPEWLAPYKRRLLRDLAGVEQQEVRWHVAPMLSRLTLSRAEERKVVERLLGYTNDRSSIVKTLAMQALADIALRSPGWIPEIRRHLEELVVIGTPAMKARGRRLLVALDKASAGGSSK